MEKNNQNNYLGRLLRRKIGVRLLLICLILTAVMSSLAVGSIITYNYRMDLNRNLPGVRNFNFLNQGKLLNAALVNNSTSVVEIAKKLGPSIVGIRTTVQTSLDHFLDIEEAKNRVEGSGIIIIADGYIMTNYHVVQYADKRYNPDQKTALEVFLPDNRKVTAKFIGGDSLNDLAVIKINLKKLPVADLGDSNKLKVGELAVAIGNPLGLEFAGSVTAGVISALNRTVMIEDRSLELIQTDAAINPGNSGGALVNGEGKVIGVNTIKISVSGVEGLGFAIPINNAKPIVKELMKYGYVRGRPFIGITGQDITGEIALRYDLPVGIFVIDVSPGSGAEQAGIQKKDIVISLAGKSIKSMQQLNSVKKGYKAGETVKVGIIRKNKRMTLNLKFSEAR